MFQSYNCFRNKQNKMKKINYLCYDISHTVKPVYNEHVGVAKSFR